MFQTKTTTPKYEQYFMFCTFSSHNMLLLR